MSKKHPIISVTGSSGAGTSTVKNTFDQIFRREGIKAVTIEGDAFHRYNRADMRAELERRVAAGARGEPRLRLLRDARPVPEGPCLI